MGSSGLEYIPYCGPSCGAVGRGGVPLCETCDVLHELSILLMGYATSGTYYVAHKKAILVYQIQILQPDSLYLHAMRH